MEVTHCQCEKFTDTSCASCGTEMSCGSPATQEDLKCDVCRIGCSVAYGNASATVHARWISASGTYDPVLPWISG